MIQQLGKNKSTKVLIWRFFALQQQILLMYQRATELALLVRETRKVALIFRWTTKRNDDLPFHLVLPFLRSWVEVALVHVTSISSGPTMCEGSGEHDVWQARTEIIPWTKILQLSPLTLDWMHLGSIRGSALNIPVTLGKIFALTQCPFSHLLKGD